MREHVFLLVVVKDQEGKRTKFKHIDTNKSRDIVYCSYSHLLPYNKRGETDQVIKGQKTAPMISSFV